MSYCLSVFDLRQAEQRNQFRVTLNNIRVLQVTAFKDIMQRQVDETLALDQSEIHHRLQERAHKNMRFHHSFRGVKPGFDIKEYLSSDRSKISPESLRADGNHIDIDVSSEQLFSPSSPCPLPKAESEGIEISSRELSGTRKRISDSSLSLESDKDEEVGPQFSKRVNGDLKVIKGNAKAPEGEMSEVLDKMLKSKGRKRKSKSSTNQWKGLSESIRPVRSRPAEPKAKLEQSKSKGNNTQPSRVPSYMKPTISNTTKAQRPKGNKDGSPVAKVSTPSFHS